MNPSDHTRCRIRGHTGLLFAIPLLLMASHWGRQAWGGGGMINYIVATAFLLACYHFISGWLDYLYNECRTTFHSESALIIRQKNRYVFRTEFRDVKKIKQDRWGYTLYVEKMGRCRFPRWHLDTDLQRIFDVHQARLAGRKQAVTSNGRR